LRLRTLKPARVLVISFLTIILVGTSLLMIPHTVNGSALSFVDALFTATSATCVTGLTVVDTGTRYTFFGQIVILVLIQVGGLGIMTLSTFFIFITLGKISLTERDIIQDTLAQKPIKNLVSLLRTTFIFTIFFEMIGAVALTLRSLQWYPLDKAVYHGIFHSISAFCNAGFALYTNSFMDFSSDFVINFTLMSLIILGGIGFIVFLDLKQGIKRVHGKIVFRISFHSKLVLIMTGILIVAGALAIFVLERQNVLLGLPFETKILASFFQSITARTAGFNTIDISKLTNVSLFFIIILMFIGASPGSCGGGIKTTTFFTLVAFLNARFKNLRDVNIFNRRVPQEILSRVISITFFSMIVIIFFTLILMISEVGFITHEESRGLFLEILFEVVSAFGTVGLSTGVTPDLTTIGKLMMSILMFIGRLGPLTIALAIVSKEAKSFKYAQENFLVG